MPSHPFPEDLLQLQRALDAAEEAWRERVLALYAHPVMREARDQGRQVDVVAALRATVRAG
ncbi:hypothetical protein [Peterkaempfera griseoplana]|uniref:hypothetical protein n=1 Tax=Peterkaempfera griseoplana TaxID=66896 RepID=UPI0006E2AE7C|nr:hypothetical protein [Peterkaempfera griseoplana]